MSIVTRFAPSPTGYLHLGHALSALSGWRRARQAGGRFLLRIEDIDRARCRPEYADAILEDLVWLGIDWDGEVRRQSAHFPEYRKALKALDAMGLVYPCFCTRAEIAAAMSAPHHQPGVYPGTCRHLSEAGIAHRLGQDVPYALRLRMDQAMQQASPLRYHEDGEGWLAANPAPFGDVVLARKDTPASYHLCVVHDDALQGISLVTRGADLRQATAIHVLLQTLLGLPHPAYAHHALLTDASGTRLAKRSRALSLRQMREAGETPEAVMRRLSCH